MGRQAVAFTILLAALSAASCDRIAYYSVTGGPSDDTDEEDDSTSPVTVGPGGGGEETLVTRGMVLQGVGICATHLYEVAEAKASVLDDAASAYADDPSDTKRDAARAAWRDAMGAWQQAEIVKVGKAAPPPTGSGLRDYVYSWPLVSRCLVEQRIVSQAYEEDDFQQSALINVRGLAAAEYLLFFESNENDCGPNATINTSGSWDAISSGELAERKRTYAAVVSNDIAVQTRAISNGWAPDGGDFANVLASAGEGDNPFKSEQAALNAVSDGLFYMEGRVKDMKLGQPLGKVDCTETSCPAAVESQYARVARDNVKNNLLGFKAIFDGCEQAPGLGFDDLLRSVGAVDLANEMSAGIDAAIAAADALPTNDFIDALSNDRAKLEALHAAVKSVTDRMKTDFVTVLDLETPAEFEGDND